MSRQWVTPFGFVVDEDGEDEYVTPTGVVFAEDQPAAVGGASIMNQLQGSNMGADLYNGTLQ